MTVKSSRLRRIRGRVEAGQDPGVSATHDEQTNRLAGHAHALDGAAHGLPEVGRQYRRVVAAAVMGQACAKPIASEPPVFECRNPSCAMAYLTSLLWRESDVLDVPRMMFSIACERRADAPGPAVLRGENAFAVQVEMEACRTSERAAAPGIAAPDRHSKPTRSAMRRSASRLIIFRLLDAPHDSA